ncbi:hypothetical protein AVEN_232590-1 [Araneus ventricosus]|uniref:Uncharacterized protein n=1 Tax=Araneus ventricosus TaxID=182803 RepID=A0A4Y2M8V7_ARAVE|nr:hypothetical protein AVEN_232590-1 [Araneus ventricosus]
MFRVVAQYKVSSSLTLPGFKKKMFSELKAGKIEKNSTKSRRQPHFLPPPCQHHWYEKQTLRMHNPRLRGQAHWQEMDVHREWYEKQLAKPESGPSLK